MKLRIVFNHESDHYEVERRGPFGWRTQEYCYRTIEGAKRYAAELREDERRASVGKSVIMEV